MSPNTHTSEEVHDNLPLMPSSYQNHDRHQEDDNDNNDSNNNHQESELPPTLSVLDLAKTQARQLFVEIGDDNSSNDDYDDLQKPVLRLRKQQSQQQPQQVPFYAYILLAATTIALASFGPILDLQQNVSGSIKAVWRQILTAIVFFPLMICEQLRLHNKNGGGGIIPHLSRSQIISMVLAAFFYSCMSMGFVTSLEYTTVGNAVILANTQSILLLLGKLFVRKPIIALEGIGALLAFAGAILCSKDGSSSSTTGEDDNNAASNNALLGDLIVFAGAGCGGVGFLITSREVRKHIPLFTFVFLFMFLGIFMMIPFQVFVLGEHITYGMDANTGLWGFLTPQFDRLPLELVQALFCNLVGTTGYVVCMKYFDNVVIAVAALMQPVVAEFLAFIFGVGVLPGWVGWVGNAAVIGGTIMVVSGNNISEDNNSIKDDNNDNNDDDDSDDGERTRITPTSSGSSSPVPSYDAV